MPPLSHPDPLIAEHSVHQRLRTDTVDMACSARSSSFLGRLWPNRRKFAPPIRPPSVSSAQEICELSSMPSKSTGLKSQWISSSFRNPINYENVYCKGESSAEDCADGTLRNALDLQVSNCESDFHSQGSHCKAAFSEGVDLEGYLAECGNEACIDLPIAPVLHPAVEANMERRGEGSEGRSQSQEVCVSPIMESLKGVMINKQRIDSGTGASHVQGLKQGSKKHFEAANVSGTMKEGNPKEGIDQMLIKRLGSFKAEEVNGIKKMRMSTLCELQRVVATLQWGNSLEEQWLAADELRRLCKDDPIARISLGQLGAIPPLISLLHSVHNKHQCTALLALLNLAAGNDVNKGAIVKAKAVPRMVGLLQRAHAELQTIIVTLFLSLSALDGNKAEIGTSGAVPVLVNLMHAPHITKDVLRTLYNLSIHPDNAKFIVEAGSVRILLSMVSAIDTCDKSLATLGNLVQTEVGRHMLADHRDMSYGILIEAMRCLEMPKCQERALYVLMMIAHHSQQEREAMVAAGIIPALLEISLLGSPLAQKRAARTLDSFRRVKAVSAPQHRDSLPFVASSTDSQQSNAGTISEKKVVDGLVRQSLHRTMQRIARRAHLSSILGDPVDSESLAAETTMRSFRRRVDRMSSSCSV